MSFYVTLPSNSSMNIFPDNTLTKFTTKLKSPLHLQGGYEVALTEIMFSINWTYRKDASIFVRELVKEGTKGRIESFEVKFYSYENVGELFMTINDYMKRKNVPLIFNFNKTTYIASYTLNTPWAVEFTDGFHRELGFRVKVFQAQPTNTLQIATEKIYENLNPINSLYVYTDIIDYQFVGDEVAPLLRVVAVENKPSFGEIVNKTYIAPHYLPVSRYFIETIRLDIRDDTGSRIHFGIGKIVIKLHFRPFNGL